MNKRIKIKKVVYMSFFSIMMFFTGIFLQRFLMSVPNNSCDKFIQTMLEYENSGLYYDARRSLYILEKRGIDTASHQYQKSTYVLLQQIYFIANYFNDILSSNKKTATFSFDTIKSILGEDTYNRIFDDFYSIERCVNFKKNTIQENRTYINFYSNIVLRRLFEQYKTDALIFAAWECVFYSKTDTIKVGDMYSTQICFKVKDIQNMYRLEFENGDVFVGDIYTEKATKKGINKRKGELVYLNGNSELHFPFEFSYYVK